MTRIEIYDKEYERINEICERLDITTEELIEETIDVISDWAFFMDDEQKGGKL